LVALSAIRVVDRPPSCNRAFTITQGIARGTDVRDFEIVSTKQIVWVIALILGIVGVLGTLNVIVVSCREPA
jgi:hypothetical protein